MKCARAYNTDYDRLNMFYVTVPATIYKLIAGARMNHPGVPEKPRATPNYGMEETSARQAQIRDAWALENMFHTKDENMHRILTTPFLSLLPREEIKGFQDNNLANKPKMKLLSVFDHLWATYGTIREEDALENTERIQSDWQSHQGIEVLFQQIEEGVIFVIFTEKSMDKNLMIDSFLVVIKRTGQYQTYYEEWVLLPSNQKTWLNNKVFWRAK